MLFNSPMESGCLSPSGPTINPSPTPNSPPTLQEVWPTQRFPAPAPLPPPTAQPQRGGPGAGEEGGPRSRFTRGRALAGAEGGRAAGRCSLKLICASLIDIIAGRGRAGAGRVPPDRGTPGAGRLRCIVCLPRASVSPSAGRRVCAHTRAGACPPPCTRVWQGARGAARGRQPA